MNAQKCLEILRQVKDAAFATVDKSGRPQVRIIDIMHVEKNKLYFLTARGKHFYSELVSTKNVAITAMTKNYEMIRLNGQVATVENNDKWLELIFKQNPSMNDVYPGDSRKILQVFEINSAEIEYFNLQDVPIFRESYSIGGHAITPKGYEITDNCIKCGACKNICPQQCIEPSENKYSIVQQHCLHCGLCYESCPVTAIAERE